MRFLKQSVVSIFKILSRVKETPSVSNFKPKVDILTPCIKYRPMKSNKYTCVYRVHPIRETAFHSYSNI